MGLICFVIMPSKKNCYFSSNLVSKNSLSSTLYFFPVLLCVCFYMFTTYGEVFLLSHIISNIYTVQFVFFGNYWWNCILFIEHFVPVFSSSIIEMNFIDLFHNSPHYCVVTDSLKFYISFVCIFLFVLSLFHI